MNIYQRINEIRKKVGYARKDKNVEGQNYRAVTHDAVTALLRNHLIEFGVVVVPSVLTSQVVKAGETKSGTEIVRYQGMFRVEFVDAERPEDKIAVMLDAHANDSSDKAPGKALSYATKYAMLKLFSIETGEDEEARVEPYMDRTPISEEQAAELETLIAEHVKNPAPFLDWLSRSVGTAVVAEIPAAKFELVKRTIQAKKAAK